MITSNADIPIKNGVGGLSLKMADHTFIHNFSVIVRNQFDTARRIPVVIVFPEKLETVTHIAPGDGVTS